MILRRLTTAFRKQDWFTVAVETLIVVFGVFIGLQVNNWNTVRADKATGEAYLERIAEDIRSDGIRLADALQTWHEDSDQAVIIVSFLEGERAETFTDWDAFQVIYWGAGWTPFKPNRVTYDELISTGQFGLVGDPALRRDIANYYAAMGSIAGFYDFPTPLRELVRSKYSPEAQAYMWEACFPEVQFSGPPGNWRDCAPFGDGDSIAATLESLKQSDELLAATRYTASTRIIAVIAAETDRIRAQELAAKVEGYLE